MSDLPTKLTVTPTVEGLKLSIGDIQDQIDKALSSVGPDRQFVILAVSNGNSLRVEAHTNLGNGWKAAVLAEFVGGEKPDIGVEIVKSW